MYGCGSDGIRLLNYMRRIDYLNRIKCLCDSNQNMWGDKIAGKQICSLEDIKKEYPDAEYLVVSINYGDEIRKKLIDSDIKEIRIHIINIC